MHIKWDFVIPNYFRMKLETHTDSCHIFEIIFGLLICKQDV